MKMTTPVLAAVALAASLLALPQDTAAQDAQRWIESVRPRAQYVKSTIAVVPFNTSNTTLVNDTLPRIIRNDLELSGFFKMVGDQAAANRQNMSDNRSGGINFANWSTLGVDHYLMGRVSESADRISVDILLYDIKSQKLIISRNFSDIKPRVRDLAHQISDAIVNQLRGVPGVARTKLLYVSEQAPGIKEIFICDWDGFNARALTSYGKLATGPSWGANGTEAYFTSYHGNRANIYGMQLRADEALNFLPGQVWTIAAYGGTNHSPAWSQSARRIAMVLSKDGNSEIYTSARDGKDLQRVTTTKATEGSPTWSPDGSKIAFTSNEAGGVHLFVMNADGSGRRRITTKGSWNDALTWAPDGARLAFVSRASGRNDIYICDVSGAENSYRRLTMNQGNNESPTWAPNSTHLAFASDRTGQWQIYVATDDGSSQRQITTVGRNTLPDWGPMLPGTK